MRPLVTAALLILVALPATAQEPVRDLVGQAQGESLVFTWRVPHAVEGAFGMLATLPVSGYDLRYSTSGEITEASWNSAIPLDGEPDPLDGPLAEPGSPSGMTVMGLSTDPALVYWFAMKTSATAWGIEGWSPLSNVVRASFNFVPPNAINSLSARSAGEGSVQLTWKAPQDDRGAATAYQLRYSEDPLDDTTWPLAKAAPELPPPGLPGADETATIFVGLQGGWFYFAIKSVDDNSNWSGPSNVVQVGVPGMSEVSADNAATGCSGSAAPLAGVPALALAALALCFFPRMTQGVPSNLVPGGAR